MTSELHKTRTLEPTHYHSDLLNYLKNNEAEVWNWAISQPAQDDHTAEVRDTLLKQSYRLSPENHKSVFDQCQKAMTVLGIDAPIHLYQIADGQMNASLFFIPGEVHIVFYGPVLEKLSEGELLALLGHEISHHLLWSTAAGEYHAVSRILDHTLSYPRATQSQYESARLFRMYTELYADRGAALVSDSSKTSIACMVKIMTGLPDVDPDAYLKQVEEIQPSKKGSTENTHPEMFIRAKAVSKWWDDDEDLEDWLDKKLRGDPSLDSIDMIQQAEWSHLSSSFLREFRQGLDIESDFLDAAAKRITDEVDKIHLSQSPSWSPHIKMNSTLRDYFFALIFDLAMADPDVRDEVLQAGANVAYEMNHLNAYREAMKRDLKIRKQTITRLTKLAGESGKT